MRNKIALFDMDDTLCDYTGQLLKDLKKIRSIYEPEVTLEQIRECYDYIEQRRHMITNQLGWFKNLPCYKPGREIMVLCAQIGYDIGILTKGPQRKYNAWSEKVEWIHNNIGKDNIDGVTVCHDKSLVYADVLVDDWPGYVEEWLKFRPRGLVIMPYHEHNKDFKHDNVIHFKSDMYSFNKTKLALEKQFARKKDYTNKNN